MKVHSTLRFRGENGNAAGMESSIAIHRNYGYVADSDGNIYPAVASDYTISDDEDISYEMLVHSKVYEAHFYQKMSDETQEKLSSEVSEAIETLKEKYTQEQLDSMTEEEREKIFERFLS